MHSNLYSVTVKIHLQPPGAASYVMRWALVKQYRQSVSLDGTSFLSIYALTSLNSKHGGRNGSRKRTDNYIDSCTNTSD